MAGFKYGNPNQISRELGWWFRFMVKKDTLASIFQCDWAYYISLQYNINLLTKGRITVIAHIWLITKILKWNNQPTIGYSVHIAITWSTTVRIILINKWGWMVTTSRATYRVVTANTTSHFEYQLPGLDLSQCSFILFVLL